MIERTGGVDPTLGVHLSKAYKISGVNPPARRDAVTISKFSALVERGRACAMALPDVRTDRVSQVRSSMDAGEMPAVEDIASAMINCVVRGQV